MNNETDEVFWMDILKDQFTFSGYLHHMLYRVLYRQQTLIIGSRIQIKLVEDLFKKLSSSFSLHSLKTNFIFHFKYAKYRRSEDKEKLVSDEKYIETLTKSIINQKNELYSKLGLEKELLIQKSKPIVLKWIKTSPNDYKSLDSMIQENFYNEFPQIRKLTHPGKKMEIRNPSEFQEIFKFLYQNIERHIDLQKQQLEALLKENKKNHLKQIQKQYLYQDLLFLKKQQEYSFKSAFIDMIITFEEWITLYLIFIVQKEPHRFLNSKGLSQYWLKEPMEKLRKEFMTFKHVEKKRSEIVSKLIQREIKNISYAGSQLKTYLEKHVSFKIILDPNDESFSFYKQLRLLRNDLVHPQPLRRSQISLPSSVEEFEVLINKLDQFGKIIVQICQLDQVNLDDSLFKKIFLSIW